MNGMDFEGTLIVNADGSINENRLTGIRRKTFRITPERIDSAPELLVFNNDVYRTFIKSGVVFGDIIEYETTFGVKLQTTGNIRTLKQFLGFKSVHADKTVDYLIATYQVNGGCENRKEKKAAMGKKHFQKVAVSFLKSPIDKSRRMVYNNSIITLSRVTEGTGPVKSGNLTVCQTRC